MRKIFPAFFILLVVFALNFVSCNDAALDTFTLDPSNTVGFTTVNDLSYPAPAPRTVTVTNNGGSPVTAKIGLSGKDAAVFTVSEISVDIEAKGQKTFTISVGAGLDWGLYQAIVTVSADNYASIPLEIRFNVQKLEKHLYIAFGQSNMQGPGEIRVQDKRYTSDRFKILNVVTGKYDAEDRTKGEWYTAVPPLIISGSLINYLQLNIGLGPSDHFGQTLARKITNEITVGLVAVANGDLALASFHKTKGAQYFDNSTADKESGRPSSTERQGWTRYTGTGANYTSIYDAIISNAKKAQSEGWIVKGIIMHQGESGRGLTYTSWHEMLKEIYNDMLSDLSLEPNSVPILLGQLWNAGVGPGGYLNTNNTLIQAVLPNAWVISTEGLTKGRVGQGQPDNIHFGSEDLEGLGKRYAEKMFELVY